MLFSFCACGFCILFSGIRRGGRGNTPHPRKGKRKEKAEKEGEKVEKGGKMRKEREKGKKEEEKRIQ